MKILLYCGILYRLGTKFCCLRRKMEMWRKIRAQGMVLLLIIMLIGLVPGGILAPSAVSAGIGAEYTALNSDGKSTTTYKVTNVAPAGDHTITENNSVYEIPSGAGIIKVDAGVTTTIILDGVIRESVDGTGADSKSPLQLGSKSKVTLVLIDGTTNIFTCNGKSTSLNDTQAGINVWSDATLIIKGQSGNTGRLIATGGAYSAGIGAGPNAACGNITIEGGQIEAIARIHQPSASHADYPGNAEIGRASCRERV